MKVRVLEDICQGHSMCILACREMFILDDETGHASVVSYLVPDQFEDAVRRASQSCPEGAIELES